MSVDRRTVLKLLAVTTLVGCGNETELPLSELEVAGSPGELGRAHGTAFQSKIRANLDFYLQWLGQAGGTTSEHLLELARGFVPVLGERFPQMLKEMEAIASGTGMRLDEVMLINARTDILARGAPHMSEWVERPGV